MIRSYSELIRLKTFEERYEYLRLKSSVGKSTFGYDRYMNQAFYRSMPWRKVRDAIIIRDNGCDLGILDREIHGRIITHHLIPITIEDLELRPDKVCNPEFLICTSGITHLAIHYGDDSLLEKEPIIRMKNDTCPWR